MPVNNIFVDSNDRSSGDSLNRFSIAANPAFRTSNVSSIGLVQYQFQYLIPNINDTNNTFQINVNATDYTIVIPRGYYRFGHVNPPTALTAGTFLEVLQERLRTITGEATFTVYPKLSAINPALYTDPANDTRLFSISATPTFTISGVSEGMAYTTGLYNMTSAASQFDSRVATMLYTSYVDIISGRLHDDNIPDETSNTASGNVLERVYLGGADLRGNEPEVISRELHNPKWLKWTPSKNLGVLTFELRDQFGNLLHIPADQDKMKLLMTFQAVDSDFNRIV